MIPQVTQRTERLFKSWRHDWTLREFCFRWLLGPIERLWFRRPIGRLWAHQLIGARWRRQPKMLKTLAHQSTLENLAYCNPSKWWAKTRVTDIWISSPRPRRTPQRIAWYTGSRTVHQCAANNSYTCWQICIWDCSLVEAWIIFCILQFYFSLYWRHWPINCKWLNWKHHMITRTYCTCLAKYNF